MAFKLTKEQQKQVDDVLKLIADTKKDIIKFKLAKIDVSAEEASLLELEEKLRAIRQTFGTTASVA